MWFRNDLRLHDHEPVAAAHDACSSVLHTYIFDPRDYGKSASGFDKTGPHRARFVLDSLEDLRQRLREAGSDLVVRKDAAVSWDVCRGLSAVLLMLCSVLSLIRWRMHCSSCCSEHRGALHCGRAYLPQQVATSGCFALWPLLDPHPHGHGTQVRIGRPEEVLPALARESGAGAVYCHSEVSCEDSRLEGATAAALDAAGCELRRSWGGTLFHVADLPFDLAALPSSYGDFREKVRRTAVRPAAELPPQLKPLPAGAAVDAGELPSMEALGFEPGCLATGNRKVDRSSALGGELKGGETEALRHLRSFMSSLKVSPAAAATSGSGSTGSTIGSDSASSRFSCQISPWLALGCLSPRHMYRQLTRQVRELEVVITSAACCKMTALCRSFKRW